MSGQAIMALDVGERRIGVALASAVARLANPLTTLANDTDVFKQINSLIQEHEVGTMVVGLPRGLDGQETAQTLATEEFVAKLRLEVKIPVYFMDEAVTSQQARAELNARGAHIHRGDIDALAASYILEDYLHEQGAPN